MRRIIPIVPRSLRSEALFLGNNPERLCLKKTSCCIGFWCRILQRLMRSLFIVLSNPIVGECSDLFQIEDQIGVKNVFPVGFVKPFNNSILCGFSRLDSNMFDSLHV